MIQEQMNLITNSLHDSRIEIDSREMDNQGFESLS